MAEHSWLFMMDAQTFMITTTKPIPLYYTHPFVSITIADQVSTTVRHPSQNASFSNSPSFSHRNMSRSFSCVVSLSHPFRLFALIPDETTTRPVNGPHTSSVIYSPSQGPSGISADCTSIEIAAPSRGHCLYRYSLRSFREITG